MSEKALDLVARTAAHQALLHRKNDLRDDFQIAVDEHIQRVGHDTLGRILNRNNTVLRPALAHFGKDVSDSLEGEVPQTRTEPPNGGLMCERCLGSEVS